jgi:mono/diheme cytochrome c family protein
MIGKIQTRWRIAMKILNWIVIIVGGIVGLVAVLAVVLFGVGSSKFTKTYDVTPATVMIPTDASAVGRGQYLFAAYCADCHGNDAGGTAFFSDPSLATFHAPNLTTGDGGVGAFYTDAGYVRAIRHGVRSNGDGLAIMPAQAFWYLSDEDLGAIIAYLKSVPPVDQSWDEKTATPLGKILIGAGVFDLFAAEHLDHSGPRPGVPTSGITADYGEYLINIGDCRLCHGTDLSGGVGPEPGSPPGPNLTPGGVLSIWSADDFIKTMRTGVTPYGRELDGNFMPYEGIARLKDDDLTAIFLYLQSLPALNTPTK